MLRVTEDDHGLILEGRLVGPWVAEVRRVVEERLSRGDAAPPSLDLSSVMYVDGDGLALLKRLVAGGLSVRAISPFVAELLGRTT